MASHVEPAVRQRMNYAPADLNPEKDLPKGFLELLLPLHKQFTPLQQKLAAKRGRSCRLHTAVSTPIICRPRRRLRRNGASRCLTGAPISAIR